MPNNVISSAFVELFPKFNQRFEQETAKQIEGSMKAVSQKVDKEVKRAVDITQKHTGRLSRIVHNQFEGIAGPIAAVFAGTALVGFFKSSIAAASDLNETISKTGVIFGEKALPQLVKFAEGADRSIGQSTHSALEAAGQFGVFGKSAGLTGDKLAKFGIDMVKLTSDMASFSNTTPEEAVYAVGAALRGETEPIRRYGVLLDDATLRQTALSMGIVKTTKQALTPQQRVLAVQAQILKQTGDAQGDFARTSGGLANQQRILRAQMSNFKDTVGKALLPVMVTATIAFNKLFTGFREGTGPGGAIRDVLKSIGGIFVTVFLPPLRTSYEIVKTFIGQMQAGVGPGGAFRDILAQTADTLKNTVTWLRENEEIAKALAITVGALVVITKAHNTVLSTQMAIIKAGSLTKYIQQIGVVSTATRVWAGVTWLVTGAMKALALGVKLLGLAFRATPIGFVVTAVALLVAGLIYAYKHSEKFRKIVDAVGKALKTAFLATLNAVTAAFYAVVDAIQTAYNWVKNFGGTIISLFADAGKWLFEKGKALLQGFMDGIRWFLPRLVDWILRAPVVKVVAPWLYAAVWLVTRGREYVFGFLKGVAAVAKNIGTWIYTNVIKPTVGAFRAAGAWLINAGRFLISGLLRGVLAYLRLYAGIAAWMWNNIGKPVINAFRAAGTWLLSAGRNLISGLLKGVLAYLRLYAGIAAWMWNNIGKPAVNAFKDAGGWLWGVGWNLIVGLGRGILDAMRGIGGWIEKNVVNPIIDNVKIFFGISSPSTVMQQLGSYLAQGLFMGLGSKNVGKAILHIFGSMPEALARIVGKGLLSIAQLPKRALDALGSVAGAIGAGFSVNPGDVFTYQGKKIQGSTFAKLQKAQELVHGTFQMLQGSFNTSVAASAGTHRGGGVIDVDQDASSWLGAVAALRHVGFAAWHRDPSQGPWGHHIHAVEIGNPTLSPEAAAQVVSFLRGGSGLAGYERGAWNILRDQLAYLHRGEMVAPAPVAAGIRGMASGVGVVNNYYLTFPHYVGDKDDLVAALDDLKRHKRLP